ALDSADGSVFRVHRRFTDCHDGLGSPSAERRAPRLDYSHDNHPGRSAVYRVARVSLYLRFLGRRGYSQHVVDGGHYRPSDRRAAALGVTAYWWMRFAYPPYAA